MGLAIEMHLRLVSALLMAASGVYRLGNVLYVLGADTKTEPAVMITIMSWRQRGAATNMLARKPMGLDRLPLPVNLNLKRAVPLAVALALSASSVPEPATVRQLLDLL